MRAMITPKALLAVFFCGLIALATLAPALAQTVDGCPGGADCIDASDFNADTDGWSAQGVSADWYAWVDILIVRGFGAVKIYDKVDGPGLVKSFYLQPGQYIIRTRAVGDLVLFNNFSVFVKASDTDIEYANVLSAWAWKNFQFGPFTVQRPQLVTLQVLPFDAPVVYLDYLYLEKLPDDSPTATPGYPTHTITPGGPTPTITPTPVPPGSQSTPLPPPTAVCQPALTGLPSYPVTPTAVVSSSFSILDSFSQDPNVVQVLPWSIQGDMIVAAGNDHTGNGSQAAFIKYNPAWGETTLADFQNALILKNNFDGGWFVNAWAQADVVPITEAAKLEIWQMLDGTWNVVSAESVSAGQWYPVHAEISSAATYVAFVATRSDLPSSGYILLDDVFVYAPLSKAPFCDGTYPDGTIGFIDKTYYDATTLLYPDDKPCPGGIMQPNNIWGMILAQATLFLDQQMAMAPAHVLGTTRDLAQQYMLGPIGGVIILGAMVFDWQVPITMMEIYLTFQAGLAIIGIWKTIRRAFFV